MSLQERVASDYANRRGNRRRAITLAEAVVATMIVGTMLVAALDTLGSATATSNAARDQSVGRLLTQQLMSEILLQNYEDPGYGPGSFGLGGDEATGNRSLWDDVDDYDNWTASPPQRKDGTVMSDFTGWGRSVAVVWVSAASPTTTSGVDTRVKRITVTVTHDNAVVATLVGLKTGALQDLPDRQ